MAHSLRDHLQSITDFRRGQGKRFSVEQMLMMIIFGYMSGNYGYRELGTFVRSNTAALQEYLGIRRAPMPSHVSIRTFLMHIDFAAVTAAFAAWAAAHLKIEPGDLVSIDGKALASTLQHQYSCEQDFVALVSVYCQRQRSVLALARYHNGQSSEAVALRELISGLNAKGALISADALHCQKKHWGPSSTAATTT